MTAGDFEAPRNDPDHVASLARGLAVLEAFRGVDGGLTLTDLSRRVGYDRAVVRRMLKTLQSLGYVAMAGRSFALTPRVLSLAAAFLTSSTIANRLQPVLEQINAESNESCSAAVLDGDEIVYIARAAGRRIMSVALSVGSRLPAHCTSMGRVLLAGLPEAERDRRLAHLPLAAMTPRTIIDPAEFRDAVLRARADGYALVDEELEIGLRSIAVPVTTTRGTVVAAVNVSLHAARVSVEDMRARILPVLQREVRRLTPVLAP